jgi:hypothetical protein
MGSTAHEVSIDSSRVTGVTGNYSCSRKLSKSGVDTATGPRLPRNPTSTLGRK